MDFFRGLPGLSLFSLEILVRKMAHLPIFQAEVIRARRAALDQGLPAVFPEDLFNFKGELVLRLDPERSYLNEATLYYFAKVILLQTPVVSFEIGTYFGARTKLIASYSPPEAIVYTLDLPPDLEHCRTSADWTDGHMIVRGHRDGIGLSFRGTPWEKNIKQLFGDSMTFDFSPYYDQVELVLIDGSHSHRYVISDTLNGVRMLKPGGIIVWDDYGSTRTEYGTTRHLDKLARLGFPVRLLGQSRRYAIMKLNAEQRERFLAM